MPEQVLIKNNIQLLREQKEITQAELAAKLGVTRSYLSKLENNKFTPGAKLMATICNYFNKSLGDIFYIKPRGKIVD